MYQCLKGCLYKPLSQVMLYINQWNVLFCRLSFRTLTLCAVI